MKVLIVEDEPSIREAEVAYMQQADYEVVESSDGQKALELFHAGLPDMVIIDINLPSVSGLEVCRQIRAVSTVPIIIVTAKDGDEDELSGLEAGADDYIKKPFNPNILVARVRGLLRRHGKERLTAGDLIVDPMRMTVTKKGTMVSLTTTQFNILVALMASQGVVLTRNQLIDIVYTDPAGHAIYDRTIDAHIKSIRRLIEDDPVHPIYIQTMIGSGYRFNGAL